MPDQPELVGVPEPSRRDPGRCRVPTRFGSCRTCADVFSLDLAPF